ncbi:MAG TPA: GntR family transcriptional regulator [Streptosporangiaceae bacterium]
MPDPLYRQIADDLQRQIEDGELGPGAQLPTELELREQYGASRNTVRDAVRWLTTRGLVQTLAGQGTFVVRAPEPFVTTLSADPETGLGGGEGEAYKTEVQAQGRNPSAREPRVEIQLADGVVADELQVPRHSLVVSRYQQRFIDGTAYSLQTSYYPMGLVEAGAVRLREATSIEPGTVNYLQEALGLSQSGYRDMITVRVADAAETAFFRLPDSGQVSVFETFRTALDGDARPFRLTVSVFAADRNQFAVFVGEVPQLAREVRVGGPADMGEAGDA